MARLEPKSQLNKSRRQRLSNLATDWDSALVPDGPFSATDLRLMLENHAGLRKIIREMVTAPYDEADTAPLSHPDTSDESNDSDKNGSTESQDAQRVLTQCRDEVGRLQRDKDKLAKSNKDLNTKNKALEGQLKQVQVELDAALANQSKVTPEVALLRRDADLAQRLGLRNLPNDDTQALIWVVAILAQRDNVERLWSALKDRCESENRPASASERGLLETALAWHNHNWTARPYRLIEAAPSSAFQFESHLRTRQASRGETVAALHLPGIADSSGTPVCKALVQTR